MKNFLLTTLPKSGTHFLSTYFFNIGLSRVYLKDIDYRIACANSMHTANKRLQAKLDKLRTNTVENILRFTDNQYTLGHYIYDPNLVSLLNESGVKILFLVRDPRDYIVSYNNHILRNPDHKHHDFFIRLSSNEERYSTIIKGNISENIGENVTPIAETFRRFRGWCKDKRVLKLHFEDIIGPKGLSSQLIQYNTFVNVNKYIDVSICDTALKKYIDDAYNTKRRLFVKGIIGQWITEFTQKENNQFDEYSGHLLEDFGYNNIIFNLKRDIKSVDINYLQSVLKGPIDSTMISDNYISSDLFKENKGIGILRKITNYYAKKEKPYYITRKRIEQYKF